MGAVKFLDEHDRILVRMIIVAPIAAESNALTTRGGKSSYLSRSPKRYSDENLVLRCKYMSMRLSA